MNNVKEPCEQLLGPTCQGGRHWGDMKEEEEVKGQQDTRENEDEETRAENE